MVVAFSTKKVVNKKERKRSDSKGIFLLPKPLKEQLLKKEHFPKVSPLKFYVLEEKSLGAPLGLGSEPSAAF